MDFGWEFPYPSQRMPVLARNAVAASQPLAAQAGIEMLRKGGNAVDAALAAAITLTVVEPTSNGIGADAFAIVWDGRALYGLNASGRSPKALSPERFAGTTAIPENGWDPVTVPGAVSAWMAMSVRFGKLLFHELFEPAVRYARNGFLVSPITARAWARAIPRFKGMPDFCEAFLPEGRAPVPGEHFRCPEQGITLEAIAESDGKDFYLGHLAKEIALHAKKTGGLLTADDLANHQPNWVTPLSLDYRGYTLHEIPQNGQGVAALAALGILDRTSFREAAVDSADSLHVQIEAMKLALADAHRYVADPAAMEIGPEALLDPGYLAERAKLIDPARAKSADYGRPGEGGTVYLAAADSRGMMVSMIQSNYKGFGSGIVIPGTGISMQNRGLAFTLEPGHPNRVAGGKRPYHTIIPGFVTKDGKPVMSFGVMGGPMQTQGHVQLLVRIADYGQNPQAASDAPRWRAVEGLTVALEEGTPPGVADELKRRGHDVVIKDSTFFGGAQVICRIEEGYCAASDHRKDGQAIGF